MKHHLLSSSHNDIITQTLDDKYFVFFRLQTRIVWSKNLVWLYPGHSWLLDFFQLKLGLLITTQNSINYQSNGICYSPQIYWTSLSQEICFQ